MSEDFSSIDLELLSEFIEMSATWTTTAEGGLETTSSTESQAIDGYPSYYKGKGLELMEEVMEVWKENRLAAKVIYDDVSNDMSVDPARIPNERIEQALHESGLLKAPDVVEVEFGERIGLEPISGFSDDPVCTSNGNFVHYDTDIETAGFAQIIDHRRTYNSLMSGRKGLFGFGWSSILDMQLVVDSDTVRVTLPDGAVIPFAPDSSGGFVPNRRRMLRVDKVDDGWIVREGAERTWLFDLDGALFSGRFGRASSLSSVMSRRWLWPSSCRGDR